MPMNDLIGPNPAPGRISVLARVLVLLLFSLASLPLGLRAQALARDGIGLVRQGRYREAKPLLDQAVKAEPKNAAAWHALGLVHNEFDLNFEKAADALEKAVTLDGRKAEYHYQLGYAYARIALN